MRVLRKQAACFMRAVSLAFVLVMTVQAGGSTAALAQEPVIERIRVDGNQRIEADTVRSYMTFKQGSTYDASEVDESVKALFDTGLFADVVIRQQGNELIVTVTENPIINRVAFEGNSAVKDEDLDEEVQLKPRTIYTRAKVQADVQRIVDLHRRSGHFSATVEPKVIQLPQNRIDLVFEIDEGPVTGIGAINFIGNDAFSDGSLREVVSTSETAWWKFLSSSDRYDPDRLTYDRELLRRHYLSEGYADFRVVSSVADLSRDGSEFYITFTVDEGEQYDFGPSKVTTELEKFDTEYLESLILTKEGDTYDAGLIDESVDALTFAAGAEGYAFAEVRPRVRRDREELTASVDYEITEGPRVYVERININGNVRTLDKVVRREMRLAEGDAFNRALLDRSEKSIRALGYFSTVEIEEEPGSAEDKTIVNVNLEEQSTGELSLGFGFSSVDNAVFDIALSERNFMGRGQFVRLRLAISGSRQAVDLRFTEPYFLDRNLVAGIDLFGTDTNYQTEAAYDARVTGFGFRFGFPTSENGSFTTRYALRQEEIRNVRADVCAGIPPEACYIQEREDLRSIVGYNYYYDQRDDPIEPTSGWDFNIDQEYAGVGGSVTYLRNEVIARAFYPFSKEFIGHLRLNGGYIDGLGDEVLINDRFYVGGSDFRGFERAGVGPRDSISGYALGAQAYAIGTAQLGFPNGLPEALDIDTSLFSDFGFVGIVDEDKVYDTNGNLAFDPQDEFAFRASAGLSVYWESPFGPVRIDLSKAFVKEDYDKDELFRFSAGTRF